MNHISFVTSALLIFSGAASAAAPDWQAIDETPANTLLVQASSVQSVAAGTAFVYRLDFKEKQTNSKNGKAYRSVVVKALIVCPTRQMKRGEVSAYAGPGGSGESAGQFVPIGDEARPYTIARGSSDEKLMKFVCTVPVPAKQ